ncbi:MAG: hypothetical protein HN742_13435 [Lentisphaerae bacterium]|mgnify:CR=1 FL=1|nr:hypothetical protein [Lentisphaerota bacterium]MBT4820874.1 hypothetical protein [Lentisphaerota bacterium]MBT5608217.1 hypothetical protein [Lentisphaerota bacterium]MBT7058894.1 hypothetical protein [Lentisphaerota bacterium]MBT7842875.1 hypothetical protein [Lentisphaerota bacterium]
MSGLMGMGLVGWIVALVVGFVVGGVFFLSIKAQVGYVLSRKGPPWLVPALMYGRMFFVGAILVVVALELPRENIPAALFAGVIGSLVARILVSRTVKKSGTDG